MVALRPMTQLEYDAYYKESVEKLATELPQATRLSLKQAREAASRSFAKLFPKHTPEEPDQHINVLLDGVQRVGVLWFGVSGDRYPPQAYVWDLLIYPPYRGRGYAKQAM